MAENRPTVDPPRPMPLHLMADHSSDTIIDQLARGGGEVMNQALARAAAAATHASTCPTASHDSPSTSSATN